MSTTGDWLPASRSGKLAMCRAWIAYITAELRTLWGIPAEEWTALQSLFTAAEAKVRFFRDRYFKMPPLTKEDWAALGFRERDEHHTPAGEPTAQATVEIFLRGPGELGFRIVYVSGDPHDKANAGYRVWYSVAAAGEAPPADPKELRESFFTRRKKDFIEFGYGDAGISYCPCCFPCRLPHSSFLTTHCRRKPRTVSRYVGNKRRRMI